MNAATANSLPVRRAEFKSKAKDTGSTIMSESSIVISPALRDITRNASILRKGMMLQIPAIGRFYNVDTMCNPSKGGIWVETLLRPECGLSSIAHAQFSQDAADIISDGSLGDV